MKFKVLAALSEDISSGWCWVKCNDFNSRKLVSIRNRSNNRTIVCEVLSIDKNYEDKYISISKSKKNKEQVKSNENTILINAWYRSKLGLENTQQEYDLIIKPIRRWDVLSRLRSCFMHSQIAIRLGTWLAILGLIVGLTSLISSDFQKLVFVGVSGYLLGRVDKLTPVDVWRQ